MREETAIDNAATVRAEIENLRHMTVGQLKDKYRDATWREVADKLGVGVGTVRRAFQAISDSPASESRPSRHRRAGRVPKLCQN